MGRYQIIVKQTARNDLDAIHKSGDKASIKRVENIFHELEQHPEKGTGRPEKLRYELTGCWSRRINKKDRLIYEINETKALVLILSAAGHYQ